MADVIKESQLIPFIISTDRYDLLAKLSEMQVTAVASSISELINSQRLSGSVVSISNGRDALFSGNETKERKDFKELYKDEAKESKDKENKEDKEGDKGKEDLEKPEKEGDKGKEDKDGKEDSDNPDSRFGDLTEVPMSNIVQLQTTSLNVLLKDQGAII